MTFAENYSRLIANVRAERRQKISSITPMIPGQHRIVCPFCNSPEESMTVTRSVNGEISAKCFRASCEVCVGNRFTAPKLKEPRYYTRATHFLTDEQDEWLLDRFGLESDPVIRYSRETDRFVLPVYGYATRRGRGYVAYSFNEQPKTLTYNEQPDEPFLHYADSLIGQVVAGLVLVEDWFSAEKVSQAAYERGWIGVALMGTHVSEDMALELAALKVPVTIALDRDAYGKSVQYGIKHGWTVWRLERDLKYVSEQRILEALDGRTDFLGTPDSQRSDKGS